jgi:hypothetical protein
MITASPARGANDLVTTPIIEGDHQLERASLLRVRASATQ